DAARDQERTVEGRPKPQLLADRRVADSAQRGGQYEPKNDWIVEPGCHHFSVDRGWPWSPAMALFRTLSLVFSSTRTWKASSSTATMVAKMPGLTMTLSPAFSVFTVSSSFFCLVRMGRIRTK